MEFVTRTLIASRYTGNGSAADVHAACMRLTQLTGNSWTVVSDDGSTLVLRETGGNGLYADWPILAGQVVVVDPNAGIIDRLRPAEFASRYRRIVDSASDVKTTLLQDATFMASISAAVRSVLLQDTTFIAAVAAAVQGTSPPSAPQKSA